MSVLQVHAQREYIYRFENLHANTRFFGFFKIAPAPDGGWAVAGCDSATGVIQVLRYLDGINDVFLPVNTCGFLDFRLSVFNRLGQLVFFSDQPESGWDGTLLR